jgi:hydroxyacylglutathione hydrolase
MAVEVGNWGGGTVWRTPAGEFTSNTYFFDADGSSGRAVIVDPGLDGLAIEADILSCGLKPTIVLCTHGHFDHTGSAAYFQRKYGTPVHLHLRDKKVLASSNFLLMLLKISRKVEQPEVTWVEDGFAQVLGASNLRYLTAPGHTPGSCVIEFGDAWFTGDTIYARGVGLSNMPGENTELLKGSILSLWDRLADVKLVCPGHGEAAKGNDIRVGNTSLLRFLGLGNQL